jgi:phasin
MQQNRPILQLTKRIPTLLQWRSAMTKVKAEKTAPKTAAPKMNNSKPEAAATATADVFAVPGMDMPEMFRDFAATGVDGAKDAYSNITVAAEEASDLMEDTLEATRDGILDLNFKALDNARQTSEATFDFLNKFYSSKSVAQAIELQSGFVSKCFASMTDQVKDLQDATTKLAGDVSQPVRDAMSKSFKDLNAM